MKATSITGVNNRLYALREDGLVFVLIQRGDTSPMTGGPVKQPFWAKCPAVPGTDAEKDQEG